MSDDWTRIEEAFHRAAELQPPERAGYLREIFADEPSLRRQVEALLAADASNDRARFIAGPALGDEFRVPGPSELAPNDAEMCGEHVGPYRLVRRIGEGGMGSVYLGRRDDGEFVQSVAVKFISTPAPSKRALTRFRHERQTLANLNHPNIARLLEGGTTEDGRPYLIMEHVEGRPIDEYCREEALTIRQRLDLFLVVCEAVQHAHQIFVVHRDLKPSNILVTDGGVPKLLDFGIAKDIDAFSRDADSARTTRTATVLTPEYASPEQLRHGAITAATDVYALGTILYELLTDVRPFRVRSDSFATIERIICTEDPRKPSAVMDDTNPEDPAGGIASGPADASPPAPGSGASRQRRRRLLRGDLDNIVMMALRKEPSRRYQTVEQLADDIRRFLRGMPVTAVPDASVYRIRKFVARHRTWIGAAASIVVLLVASTISSLWLARRASHERDVARLAQTAERDARLRAEIAEKTATRAADRAQAIARFLVGLFRVADPYRNPGSSPTAAEILQRGRTRVEAELADQPALQAGLLSTLGEVYTNLGSYEEALEILERSVSLFESLDTQPGLEYAEALSHLGRAQTALGRYEEASATYHRVLGIRQATLGDRHERCAETLIDLGGVNVKRGRYEEAERQLLTARALLEASPGSHALLIGEALRGMGEMRFEQGEFAEAEMLLRSALDHYRGEMKPDDLRLSSLLQDVGAAMHAQGKLAEAGEHYREALTRLEAALEPDHPLLVEPLSNLAALALDNDDEETAARLFRRVLSIQRSRLGEEHPNVAETLCYLGVVEDARGNTEQALSYLRRAADIQRRVLPADHLERAVTLGMLGEILAQTGQPLEGEPILREALDIRRRVLSEDHWQTAVSRSMLGGCYAVEGRFEEAERLLLPSLPVISGALGRSHELTLQAAQRIVRLYDEWGKPDQAAEVRRVWLPAAGRDDSDPAD